MLPKTVVSLSNVIILILGLNYPKTTKIIFLEGKEKSHLYAKDYYTSLYITVWKHKEMCG